MADHAAWQQQNETYLAKAFAWQRLRLTRFSARQQPGTAGVSPATHDSVPFDTLQARRLRSQATETGEDVDALSAELEAFEQESPPPALIVLSRLFKLSRFERNLLLLCAGMELDPSIAQLCARAERFASCVSDVCPRTRALRRTGVGRV